MKEDPSKPSLVSTGGKENCLKLYDLNRPDAGAVFKAKNVSIITAIQIDPFGHVVTLVLQLHLKY